MTLMLDRTVLEPTETVPAEIMTTEMVPTEVVPAQVVAAQVVAAPAAPSTRARWQRPVLSPTVARLTGLGIMVAFVVAVAVEPAPNGPQPVLPFWADAIATATLVALLGCWLVLASGRRSGLRLGVIAGAGLVTQTALCPVLDHHVIAAWWWGQLAVSVAITAVCVGLLAGTRSSRRS